MKGNKKQREKEAIKAKTKPPHSIGASAKVVNVSKKSQVIQKKPEKAATLQSKLITVKNENGSQSLLVSKASPVPTSSKKHETRLRSTAVAKTAQVEPKVRSKSSIGHHAGVFIVSFYFDRKLIAVELSP